MTIKIIGLNDWQTNYLSSSQKLKIQFIREIGTSTWIIFFVGQDMESELVVKLNGRNGAYIHGALDMELKLQSRLERRGIG
jgi:hypothetical protein